VRIPHAPENDTFTGSVNITIRFYQTTDTVVLHQKNLHIPTSAVTLQPLDGGKALRVVSGTTDEERDLVRLKLETQVPKNSSYALIIPEFGGAVAPSSKEGLFREKEFYRTGPGR